MTKEMEIIKSYMAALEEKSNIIEEKDVEIQKYKDLLDSLRKLKTEDVFVVYSDDFGTEEMDVIGRNIREFGQMIYDHGHKIIARQEENRNFTICLAAFNEEANLSKTVSAIEELVKRKLDEEQEENKEIPARKIVSEMKIMSKKLADLEEINLKLNTASQNQNREKLEKELSDANNENEKLRMEIDNQILKFSEEMSRLNKEINEKNKAIGKLSTNLSSKQKEMNQLQQKHAEEIRILKDIDKEEQLRERGNFSSEVAANRSIGKSPDGTMFPPSMHNFKEKPVPQFSYPQPTEQTNKSSPVYNKYGLAANNSTYSTVIHGIPSNIYEAISLKLKGISKKDTVENIMNIVRYLKKENIVNFYIGTHMSGIYDSNKLELNGRNSSCFTFGLYHLFTGRYVDGMKEQSVSLHCFVVDGKIVYLDKHFPSSLKGTYVTKDNIINSQTRRTCEILQYNIYKYDFYCRNSLKEKFIKFWPALNTIFNSEKRMNQAFITSAILTNLLIDEGYEIDSQTYQLVRTN